MSLLYATPKTRTRAPFRCFPVPVQCTRNRGEHVVWHGGIDLGELNKGRVEVPLLGFQ